MRTSARTGVRDTGMSRSGRTSASNAAANSHFERPSAFGRIGFQSSSCRSAHRHLRASAAPASDRGAIDRLGGGRSIRRPLPLQQQPFVQLVVERARLQQLFPQFRFKAFSVSGRIVATSNGPFTCASTPSVLIERCGMLRRMRGRFGMKIDALPSGPALDTFTVNIEPSSTSL